MKILHVLPALNKGGGIQKVVSDIVNQTTSASCVHHVVYLRGGRSEYSGIPDTMLVYEGGIAEESIWYALKYLRSIVTSGSYDVIHAHSPPSSTLAAIASVNFEIGFVVTNHNTNFSWTLALLERIIHFKTSVLIGVSDVVTKRNKKRAYFVKSLSFETIYNAVDIGIFRGPQSAKIELDNERVLPVRGRTITFGFMGRIVHQKGWDLLIDATAILKGRGYEIAVLMAGHCKNPAVLEKKISRCGVRDNVKYLGVVEDIGWFYRNVDIAVFPSRWEGFGLSAVEAVAYGCPVIATDLDVFEEVLEGNYIKVGVSAKSIADKFEEVINGPSVRFSSRSNRSNVLDRFSLERLGKDYLSVYHSVYGSRN